MEQKHTGISGKNGLHSCSFVLLALIVLLSLSGCYSLKNISIADNVQTYYVGDFKLLAQNAPATITQTFAESLKDKISRESRLKFSEEEPHIEFNGSIQSFSVTAVAPLPNEQTAFNRLTITVNVEYINNLDPKDKWTRNFSHFEDFDASGDLLAIQDELIEVIFKQILEDIFNQAFNNW
ncbi:MAG: LptE family protein [Saprospiraceae bacterium]